MMKFNKSAKHCQELSRCVQNGRGSSPDGSNMASRAPKTARRRPREPPRRLLYASRAVPAPPMTPLRPPKTPPRLSKSLQDGSVSLQDVSRSSPEEVFEAPSRLQKLSGDFQASSCCPAASSLWPPNGLGGMREALTIKILRFYTT